MTTNTEIKVAGVALYFEFVKHNVTTQILLMPEGQSSTHKTVPMTVYRRRITSVSNRKTWKASSSFFMSKTLLTSTEKTEDQVVEELMSTVSPLFKSIVRNDYVLHKQIVAVEVTPEDLQASDLGKTPYKVLGRVTKVRKALGFPKETIFPVVEGVIMYPAAATATPSF